MAQDFEVRGLAELGRLSGALRAAGDQGKGFKRELGKSINAETKQTRKEMRDAILPGLPQSGGLAVDVQRSTRFTTRVSTGGKNVGVRIVARGRRNIRRMNATGSVRHKVFGNLNTWVTQTAGIEKGFLDKPFDTSRPELQQAVTEAISRIRSQIYRSTS